MAVLARRSKSVSFRLSEQEYKALMEVCQTQGARCVYRKRCVTSFTA
jgi:hypothetical protein